MRTIGWILGLLFLIGGAAAAVAKPAITDARLGVEPGLTRVVISLTQRNDLRVCERLAVVQQSKRQAGRIDLARVAFGHELERQSQRPKHRVTT